MPERTPRDPVLVALGAAAVGAAVTGLVMAYFMRRMMQREDEAARRAWPPCGASSCEMADAGETRRRPCDVTEVAAQPPPGWLASKLLVANPSFSVAGGDWVPCSQSG